MKATAVSFVDASVKGAGGSTIGVSNTISVLHNIYSVDPKSSSNFRELHNLVDVLEKEYLTGNYKNREVFICTDNSVAERAFYKGNSRSPTLFNFVLRLRKLQLKANFKIHVVHVAGTRMIEQGTDGLSRGMVYEGLLGARYNFLNYLPLNKSSISRSPKVLDWIRSWAPFYSEVLEPEGWFELGHDICSWEKSEEEIWRPIIGGGCWIWDPPPVAAYKVAEQIRIARHKRQTSSHIFVCPRLLTSMWRAQLHKSADLVMELPVSIFFWGKEQHEPLVLGLYLPMFHHKPWFYRGTNLVESSRILARQNLLDNKNASFIFTFFFEIG